MTTSQSHVSADAPGGQTTRSELAMRDVVTVGIGSGIAGGLAMAAPLVIWDLVRAGHRALELPMAVTAWLSGLEHFSRTQNLWGPIVIGAAVLLGYSALNGLAFAALADRAYGVSRTGSALAAGTAWGFVSFIFFWYMLLPITRGGAPLARTASDPRLFVAPAWVWILGFALLGVVTGACYSALRRLSFRSEAPVGGRAESRMRVHRAA